MITLSQLSKSYGGQTLFEDVSLQFNPGRRYGVVGANGSGKSTLLRIIAGDEEPSSGEIGIPRRASVGVLRQDHFQYENVPIVDVVMMGHTRLWQAFEQKERILSAPPEQFDADKFGEIEEFIQQNGGYALEAKAAEILVGLNIDDAVHREPLSILSGGYKLRVLLGQVLAADPDILLLDEPTNHLDILSIRWLEKFLEGYRGCALVVSHDHRFLNNVCTNIVDVDYQSALMYPGNYDKFVKAKATDRERREAEIEQREKEISRHKQMIDRFKAKPTKARQAQSKAKLVDRIVIDDLPRSSRRYPSFEFKQCRPSGRQALEIRSISKAFGDNEVLNDVSLKVQRGDRLAIIGPNGIGKSTLLKIAVGRLEADAGEVEWGYETYPGYFAQDHKEIVNSSSETVESWLWNFCAGETVGFVRGQLARVLFQKDEVEKRLSSLSGGEAARLIFARLSVDKPNVLVLDEPTNHLDLEGIEALVKGLRKYEGTLIFVSHDRWFVSKLATRVLEITKDRIEDFDGTYDEYLQNLGDDHLDAEAVIRKARQEKKQDKKKARGKK